MDTPIFYHSLTIWRKDWYMLCSRHIVLLGRFWNWLQGQQVVHHFHPIMENNYDTWFNLKTYLRKITIWLNYYTKRSSRALQSLMSTWNPVCSTSHEWLIYIKQCVINHGFFDNLLIMHCCSGKRLLLINIGLLLMLYRLLWGLSELLGPILSLWSVLRISLSSCLWLLVIPCILLLRLLTILHLLGLLLAILVLHLALH